MAAPTPKQENIGIVKQVLSGDAVIIRGKPRGGPPPERQVCLTNVTAPRLARKANPNVEGSMETKDEPYAWQAREFLRKKLIGKEVSFTIEYTAAGSGRPYGYIYVKGADGEKENVTESIVKAGLVEVRRGGIKPSDDQTRLNDFEDQAKAAGNGKWAKETDPNAQRNIIWNVENPRHLVDSLHNKPVDAIIEHVRDGCTVRAFLLPTFHHVTVMMSGIKCPMFKRVDDHDEAEPFAEEAKYFTESRLLQREVKIILEGQSNQNYIGTILHPAGVIAEKLLREGFARCVDWSMGLVTSNRQDLRAAEKYAKEQRLKIWKDYQPNTVAIEIADKTYNGKVVEIVNADALVIKTGDEYRKITLSSIRPPRLPTTEDQPRERRIRPLYDIPYMFEAREFLRKKLIGKKVSVHVDYIKPASDGYPEKTCATVTIGSDINLGEALVAKGLATVIRHRQDDDQRSSKYDDLLAAEMRAIKNSKGLHSKKEAPLHKVAEVSGAKAKQFLSFLQRAGRTEAVVEFVASGSRLRLYLFKETCLITFLLAGITCPRMARTGPGGPADTEPFSEEALQYTKELCLQREIEVEVDTMDKAGNFIGFLFVDGQNLSVALVEHGLAKIHFSAERSNYCRQLLEAEEQAKNKKLKIWEKFEEPKQQVQIVEDTERKTNYKRIVVTEVGAELDFYAQMVDAGPQFETLMQQMRAELEANPPLPGSYTPSPGQLCACKFALDGEWYRARIEKVTSKEISVFFIDFGNRDTTSVTNLATLPPAYHTHLPQAHHYYLACIQLPKDEEYRQDALDAFAEDILNHQFMMNVEYHNGSQDFVTLQIPESQDDVSMKLIRDGLVIAEKRRDKRLQKIVQDYAQAQDVARKNRVHLWRYGDFTEDDATEFGFQN